MSVLLFAFLLAQIGSPPTGVATGVASGVVLSSNGTPSAGVRVYAIPVRDTTVPENSPVVFESLAQTDATGHYRLEVPTGRYRLEKISPDSYYVMAGNSDSPNFYPGTRDAGAAKAVTTTPATVLDAINFTIALPSKGVTIRGRTSGMSGEPAGRATMEIRSLDPLPSGMASLLPDKTYKPITAGLDGSYEFSGVLPGSYSVSARLPGAPAVAKTVVVGKLALDMNFAFPVAILSARILWEEGSPESNPPISEVAVNTISNPNLVATTIFRAAAGGEFNMILESGQYRFFLRDLPEGYKVQSIRSGTADLIKEPLDVGQQSPSGIEVRIGKTRAASSPTDTAGRVHGKVLDAGTGRPPQASRVQLCCFASGPVERRSTVIGSDGSFEFSDVPAGQYTAELRSSPPARIVNPEIVVEDHGTAALSLTSSALFVPIDVTFRADAGSLPPGSIVSVTLASVTDTATPGFQITKSGSVGDVLSAAVPIGVRYAVTVSELPAAFKVKSIISETTDLMSGPLQITTFAASPRAVQITLTPGE